MKWLVAHPMTKRIEDLIPERPLLYLCCAEDGFIGDVRVDARRTWATTVQADMGSLPFRDDSFGAAYFDPPWGAVYKDDAARAMKELVRIAPVVYTLGPWLWGTHRLPPPNIQVRWQPGFMPALLFVRYAR